jgi:tetratricopeptide (TPR) repeat protein
VTQQNPKRARARPARILLATVGAGALGVAGYFYGYPQTQAYIHWRQAKDAIHALDSTRAKEHLEICAEVWPRSGETQFQLARACRRLGQVDEAADHLKRAEESAWSPDDVQLERMLLQVARGETSEVENTLIHMLQAGHPDELLIFEALLEAYLEIQYVQEVERWGTVWIERYPQDYRAYLARGRAYDLQYRNGFAIEDYKKAVSLQPTAPEAHFALGDAYRENGLLREAFPHLQYTYERRPDNPRNVVSLARCHRMLGEPEKARDLLDRWLATHEPTEVAVLALRGRVERDLSDPEKALVWLKRAEALSPQDAATVSMLANVYRELGRTEDAQKYLRRVEDITKQYNRLDYLMRRLIENRNEVSSRQEMGMLLVRLGQGKAGLRWLLSALELDPLHPPTHLALADYYDSIGDHEQAKKHRLAAAGKLRPIP